MKIRLTTFNCENLFGRYRFLDKASPVDSAARLNENYTNTIQIYEVVALEGRSNRVKPQAIAKTQRINTAGAILGAAPDILCVNEVENLPTLRIFNAIYLKNYFDRIVLIEGNDNRGIDVGVLVKRDLSVDLENVRTHADEAYPTGWLPGSNRLNTKILGAATFSRDCLEVDLKIGSSSITLLVNHLKAQSIDFTTKKDTSTQRRLDQAKRVAAIAAEVKNRGRQPIILGDMNKDSREAGYDGSLDPLVKNDALYDPFPGFQPDAEIWSHYYSGDRKVSRLDYILLDASLKSSAKGAEYFRQGLTPKCKQYAGPRLKTLKEDGQEASDHL
jgi:hypothetical protein